MNESGSLLAWALALLAEQSAADAASPALPAPRDSAARLGESERAFLEAYPDEGAEAGDLAGRTEQLLGSHLVNGRSPRFMNQLFSGVHDAGLAGALLGLASNNTLSTREVAPLPSAMETAVLGWMLRHLPWDAERSGGTITPGGSFSNYLAVHLARRRACAQHGHEVTPRLALFTSEAAHYSISKGADFAGLAPRAVIEVAADAQNRMLPAALAEAVTRSRADGLVPFFVNATLGTTVAGTLDPVDAIADVAVREGLWLHVDGAWGAFGLLGSEWERFTHGLPRADSLTWDAHKAGATPMALSCLMVRDRRTLDVLRPEGRRGSYLFQHPHLEEPEEEDLGLTSVYCGKPFLSLGLWLLWKSLGASGLRDHVDRSRELALRFRAAMEASASFEVTHDTETWAVCFRAVGPNHADPAAREEFSERVHGEMNADGRWMIRLCPATGGLVFRAIFVNPLMTAQIADDLAAALERAHAAAGAPVEATE